MKAFTPKGKYKSIPECTLLKGIAFWLMGFIWLSLPLNGQIVDDSTKQIYSSKTTGYVLEDDFRWNRYNRIETDTSLNIMAATHKLDTTLNDIHNFNFVYGQHNIYQNLGTFLTPLNPVYFEHPTEIGKRLGFDAFNPYALDPEKIKYFDSKSPYTNVNFVQGGKRQQIMEIEHARNITYNWSAGLFFKRMTSQKVVGALAASGLNSRDKVFQASHYSFALFTRYFTTNERYQILANFTHLHHTNFDTGGIIPEFADEEEFLYERERVNLFQARTLEKRKNYHVFQEYFLNESKTVQVYHTFDYGNRIVRYNDVLKRGVGEAGKTPDYYYYDTIPFSQKGDTTSADSTIDNVFKFTDWWIQDRTQYTLLENSVGVKGKWDKLSVDFYFKNKRFSYKQLEYTDTIPGRYPFLEITDSSRTPESYIDTIPIDQKFVENFIGANLYYTINENSGIAVTGEYIFSAKSRKTGLTFNDYKDYKFDINYHHKWFKLGFAKAMYSPTLVQREYRSNLFQWNNWISDDGKDVPNRFLQSQSAYTYAGININGKFFSLAPRITYNKIDNFIYYDTLAIARQTFASQNFLSFELKVRFNVGVFNLELFGKYTKEDAKYFAWRVPEIFTRNRMYFQGYLFKKATLVQIGVDQFWKSGYNAYKYMPVTNQFYENIDFPIKNYTLVDIFLNVQIKTVRAFVKLSNATQPYKGGYYITPFYSGLPRTFDFGINWRFYD